MKYFTKEWCFGDLDEKEINNIVKKYKAYIKSEYSKFPFVLKVLSSNINLHDGIVRNIIFDQNNNFVRTSEIFGDLEVGYFH